MKNFKLNIPNLNLEPNEKENNFINYEDNPTEHKNNLELNMQIGKLLKAMNTRMLLKPTMILLIVLPWQQMRPIMCAAYFKIKFENENNEEKYTHKGCYEVDIKYLADNDANDINDLVFYN